MEHSKPPQNLEVDGSKVRKKIVTSLYYHEKSINKYQRKLYQNLELLSVESNFGAPRWDKRISLRPF